MAWASKNLHVYCKKTATLFATVAAKRSSMHAETLDMPLACLLNLASFTCLLSHI
jgi:hypothetical protein